MPSHEEIAKGRRNGAQKGRKGRLSTVFAVDDQARDVVTWEEANPTGIVALTVLVSSLGGAITFGGSRDRGALQLALFLDGERHVKWIPAGDDVDHALAEIFESLDTLK